MRRNLIAGAVGLPVGAIIILIALSSTPESQNEPVLSRTLAVVLHSLVYGYLFWSAFWGFPKVWQWWRVPITNLYQLASRIEFSGIVAVLLIVGGLCALPPALLGVFVYFYALFWVGLFYSFFGGGVYQFLQARKVVKANQ